MIEFMDLCVMCTELTQEMDNINKHKTILDKIIKLIYREYLSQNHKHY